MLEKYINISFKYDINEMMEIKDKDTWFLRRIRLIIDTTKMRRKQGWVDKLSYEVVGNCDGADIEENKDNVIIDILNMDFYYDFKISQEECYKFASEDLIYRENILKKFRIKNYELIYEFESAKWFIEENEGLIEFFKNSSVNEEDFDKSDVF
jgi:hypothetical protein